MSEHVPDMEHLEAARREVMEAIGHYADGWNTTEGGLVTEFIVLAEIAAPSGRLGLLTIRGAGDGGGGDQYSWRIRGMLHEALHDLDEPSKDE